MKISSKHECGNLRKRVDTAGTSITSVIVGRCEKFCQQCLDGCHTHICATNMRLSKWTHAWTKTTVRRIPLQQSKQQLTGGLSESRQSTAGDLARISALRDAPVGDISGLGLRALLPSLGTLTVSAKSRPKLFASRALRVAFSRIWA